MTKLIDKIEFTNSCEDYEWEDICDDIQYFMGQIKGYTGNWRVDGRNMGWRNRSGYKEFYAEEGREFLWGILPETECNGTIEFYEDRMEMTNFHHDSPMGEFYTIKPIGDLDE